MFVDLHIKYQKSFTKLLRKINKSVKEDDYLKGRYYILQRKSNFYDFSDLSGAIMYVQIRIYDKKTNYYKDFYLDYAPYLHLKDAKIWIKLNDFIVNDSRIFKEKYITEDYSKIQYIKNDKREDNFFCSYEEWRKINEKTN